MDGPIVPRPCCPKNFVPALIEEGDELYPNGIFVFNITKMLTFIQSHPEKFIPERVAIRDYTHGLPSIKEADPTDTSGVAGAKRQTLMERESARVDG